MEYGVLRLCSYTVQNLTYVMLAVNFDEFADLLRGVVADSEDTIRASAEALGKHGFINYFGLQVFSCSPLPFHCPKLFPILVKPPSLQER